MFIIYDFKQRSEGKTQKCAKLMVLGLCWGWLVGNNTINLDFWAHFLCYFLLALKESKKKKKTVNQLFL
jgi:hypothetical protein